MDSPSPSLKVDAETVNTLLEQIRADPSLPVSQPTTSLWQEKLHPLSHTQSPSLPERVEYAIIGSGVTGCAVAKTLLEDARSNGDRVTILEARTLCSGATGRNGGHLVSPVPGEFADLVAAYGIDMAIKIARYHNRTLEKMHQLAAEADESTRNAAEVRTTRSILGLRQQHLFDECKESVELYMKHVPEAQGSFRLIDTEEARTLYGLKDCYGALDEPSGAFWPYRLITGTFGDLHSKHRPRFTIETQTPVLQISQTNDQEWKFLLETPRGSLLARHVIHCTNGHTSHLLPRLRGIIYPFRGTMSVQSPDPSFPRLGDRLSWALFQDGSYNPSDGIVESDLYYITQNAKTGDFFVGGEKSKICEMVTGDDGTICDVAKENIGGVLPRIFERYGSGKIKGIWSGILGFTIDFHPLVGSLPRFVTDVNSEDEGASGQWIAAGFNGYGMPQCWSAGEAVAKLIMGGDSARSEVFEWLPEVFEVKRDRFDFKHATESGLKGFMQLLHLEHA